MQASFRGAQRRRRRAPGIQSRLPFPGLLLFFASFSSFHSPPPLSGRLSLGPPPERRKMRNAEMNGGPGRAGGLPPAPPPPPFPRLLPKTEGGEGEKNKRPPPLPPPPLLPHASGSPLTAPGSWLPSRGAAASPLQGAGTETEPSRPRSNCKRELFSRSISRPRVLPEGRKGDVRPSLPPPSRPLLAGRPTASGAFLQRQLFGETPRWAGHAGGCAGEGGQAGRLRRLKVKSSACNAAPASFSQSRPPPPMQAGSGLTWAWQRRAKEEGGGGRRRTRRNSFAGAFLPPQESSLLLFLLLLPGAAAEAGLCAQPARPPAAPPAPSSRPWIYWLAFTRREGKRERRGSRGGGIFYTNLILEAFVLGSAQGGGGAHRSAKMQREGRPRGSFASRRGGGAAASLPGAPPPSRKRRSRQRRLCQARAGSWEKSEAGKLLAGTEPPVARRTRGRLTTAAAAAAPSRPPPVQCICPPRRRLRAGAPPGRKPWDAFELFLHSMMAN